MKLSIVNRFPCAPDKLWDLFADPEFDRRLEVASGLHITEVERQEEGGRLRRRLRCESRRELPAVIAKLLGTSHLTYDQVNVLDRGNSRLDWEVIPAFLTDKVTARGFTTAKPIPEGSERRIDGDILVRIPVVGGRVEKAIVEQVEKSYQRAADVALEMLREGR